jgi:hypothetical protein
VRSVLVAALSSCADNRLRPEARRFLGGLSADELQFIAEFLGASVLESQVADEVAGSRRELAERLAEFHRTRFGELPSRDQDHKTILLLEFLCRSGLRKAPAAARAAHA